MFGVVFELSFFCCYFVARINNQQQQQQIYVRIKRTDTPPTTQNGNGEYLSVPRHLYRRKTDIRVSENVSDTRKDESRQREEQRDPQTRRRCQGETCNRTQERTVRVQEQNDRETPIFRLLQGTLRKASRGGKPRELGKLVFLFASSEKVRKAGEHNSRRNHARMGSGVQRLSRKRRRRLGTRFQEANQRQTPRPKLETVVL